MPSTINHRIVRDEIFMRVHQHVEQGAMPSKWWAAEMMMADFNCGIHKDVSTWERYQDWKKEKGI